jgi:mRNA-degrading endonuclease toxin of MazEF toxin-antitoxin module
MPATPLNPAERFSALGSLEVVFVPVIAAANGIPTRAEIDAGTDLTTEIAEWGGFLVQSETIDVPDLTRYTGTIPGRITVEPGTLSIYADRGADDARNTLQRDKTGYILLMDNGDTPTELMDVWPVQVSSLAKARSMDAATLLQAAFSHPRLPVEDVAIPAYAI